MLLIDTGILWRSCVAIANSGYGIRDVDRLGSPAVTDIAVAVDQVVIEVSGNDFIRLALGGAVARRGAIIAFCRAGVAPVAVAVDGQLTAVLGSDSNRADIRVNSGSLRLPIFINVA